MKNKQGNRGSVLKKFFCALLAALTGTCILLAAAAEKEDSPAVSPELILARSTASWMDLRTPEGEPLEVYSDASVPGRGKAGPDGEMPDYTGLLGFAALPNDPGISKFSVFDKAYWTIPLYTLKNGEIIQEGTIAHKTPVLVAGQALEADGNGGYRGMLDIVRLDIGEKCLLDVSCFVTLPYWTLPLREAQAYGYCIAVYRETPGAAPRKENGDAVSLRDGTRILIPFEGACSGENPNPAQLTVQGVVFREDEEGKIAPVAAWFRENDLSLNY